jgi:hypothetical protein
MGEYVERMGGGEMRVLSSDARRVHPRTGHKDPDGK